MSEKRSKYSNQDMRYSQEVHYNHTQQENQHNMNPQDYQDSRYQQDHQQPRKEPNGAAPPAYSEKDPQAQSNTHYEHMYKHDSVEEDNVNRSSQRSSQRSSRRSSRRSSQTEIQGEPKKSSSTSSVRSTLGRVASAVVVAIDTSQFYKRRRRLFIRRLLVSFIDNGKTADEEKRSKR